MANTPNQNRPRRLKPWSERETETLFKLWGRGFDCERIACVIGRNPTAVSVKACRLGLTQKDSPAETEATSRPKQSRKCMSCGRQFQSHGIGNRICKRCKSSSKWTGQTESSLRMPGSVS